MTDTISSHHGDSLLEAEVDPLELGRLVRAFNHHVVPLIEQACRQHRIPVPVGIDVILPRAEVTRAVVRGQALPAEECQLYLRFYQGGQPDLVLVAPELDIAMTFPLEDIVP